MIRRLAVVMALAASVGWTVPLLCSVWFVVDWCRLEVAPSVYGHEMAVNSFPFLAAAGWMLNAAVLWFIIASAAWTILGLRFIFFGADKARQGDAADSR